MVARATPSSPRSAFPQTTIRTVGIREDTPVMAPASTVRSRKCVAHEMHGS